MLELVTTPAGETTQGWGTSRRLLLHSGSWAVHYSPIELDATVVKITRRNLCERKTHGVILVHEAHENELAGRLYTRSNEGRKKSLLNQSRAGWETRNHGLRRASARGASEGSGSMGADQDAA